EKVERFLDACLTIEHLIDPYSMFMQRDPARVKRTQSEEDQGFDRDRGDKAFIPDRLPAKDYMDPFITPVRELQRQKKEYEQKTAAMRGKIPARPTRDILLFLLRHAPIEEWQQDILSIIRDEAYYFAPQAMTKVIN